MNVTIIGTGYVGTVTGACLAYLGHRVWCVDTDAAKIEKLQAGQSPIFEPGLEDLMRLCTERGLLEFTTDLTEPVRQSDVIFVAVGTPPLPSGESNLTYVEAAARSIGAVMDTSIFRVVVNKSTVPVGSGNLVGTLVREGISAAGRQNVRFGMASNPEFLREGSAIHDSLYPDRIVIGTEEPETLAVMRNLYAELGSQQFPDPSFEPRPLGTTSVPVVETTLTSAEMIKYSANAFLATKIGFANEIANICERVGADVTEVMQGIGLDSRIGTKFLNAGIGWGGSCFGKDIGSLLHTAGEYGYQASLLEASLLVNKRQRLLVIQKLQEKLFILKGRTIGLLGLSFKPNTDDLRDAPSLQIAERLIQMGARVRAYDPISMDACREQNPDLRILYCNDALSMAEHADALVLITEWPEFGMLDLRELASRMDHAVLIDGRNMFDAAHAAHAGFDYTGMGRATHRTATPASK